MYTRQTLRPITATVLALVAVVALAATVGVRSARAATVVATTATYDLPGAKRFPEGMGYDNATGNFYTGSLTDGSAWKVRSTAPRRR